MEMTGPVHNALYEESLHASERENVQHICCIFTLQEKLLFHMAAHVFPL